MSDNHHLNKFFILIGLIALFVIPELNNVHYDPQPQFWAEISVAWIILALFVFICMRLEYMTIPSIIVPVGLFMLFLLIQPYLVNIDFPGLNYVTVLELFSCLLLAISVNTIKETFGIKTLVSYLCYALLIGAILQTLIGFIQYTGSSKYFGDMIFYDSSHPTTNIFGHFGQRNHYAHYLTWATLAIVYLHHQKKIAALFFYPLILWLSFSITIAASRSVFIYFPLALLFSGAYWLSQRNRESKRLFALLLVANLMLFTFEYLYPLIHEYFSAHNNFKSGLERLGSEGVGRRSTEWQKAWLVFKANPLWGGGWNEYAKQSVLLFHLFPNTVANDGLFTNCHNLIFQLLAETGISGTLIVVLGIFAALYRTLRNSFSVETVILSCMLATTLAHSMNEYPLWYMYFLAGLFLFLSCDKPLAKISTKLMAGIFSLPLAGLIYLMLSSSVIFDNLVADYDTPDDQPSYNRSAHYLQQLVDHNRLWSYFALYTLDNYIVVDAEMTNKLYPLATQLAYTNKLVSFHPYPDTMIKAGMLEWNSGQKEAAKAMVSLATLAFPVYNSSYKDTLKAKRYKPLRVLVP